MISQKHLLNLPVETKSGVKLGRISGFDIDIDSQSIIRYYVKSENLIKGFLRNELVIHRSQVLSISSEKMVVEDNIAPEPALLGEEKVKIKSATPHLATSSNVEQIF